MFPELHSCSCFRLNVRSDHVVSSFDKKRYACSKCHQKGHNKTTCPLGKDKDDFESRLSFYLMDSDKNGVVDGVVAEEEHYLQEVKVDLQAEQLQEYFQQAEEEQYLQEAEVDLQAEQIQEYFQQSYFAMN